MAKKKSFFERLTGAVDIDDIDEEEMEEPEAPRHIAPKYGKKPQHNLSGTDWMEEEAGEGQLAVDVHQTQSHIVIKAMVAGVDPDDLDISITRDMVTIRGKREESREVSDDDYFFRELYWGAFSRTIVLPQEVDPDEAEAEENKGLLTIKLPKLDKGRQTKLKIKSVN